MTLGVLIAIKNVTLMSAIFGNHAGSGGATWQTHQPQKLESESSNLSLSTMYLIDFEQFKYFSKMRGKDAAGLYHPPPPYWLIGYWFRQPVYLCWKKRPYSIVKTCDDCKDRFRCFTQRWETVLRDDAGFGVVATGV